MYEGNKAKRNEIKWREARDKIIAECGGETEKAKGRSNKAFDWKKLDAWDERNTKKQFKLDDEGHILLFEDLRKAKYDLLAKKGWTDEQIEVFLTDDKTYTENKERINKMLAPYRRLDNGEVDMYNLPELIKQKVIKLQNENAQIRKAQKKALDSKDKKVLKQLRELDKKYYNTQWTQQFADAVALARKKDIEDATKMGMTPDDIGNPHVTKLLASHGYIK